MKERICMNKERHMQERSRRTPDHRGEQKQRQKARCRHQKNAYPVSRAFNHVVNQAKNVSDNTPSATEKMTAGRVATCMLRSSFGLYWRSTISLTKLAQTAIVEQVMGMKRGFVG